MGGSLEAIRQPTSVLLALNLKLPNIRFYNHT